MKPANNKVLLKPIEPDRYTEGGIIIPDTVILDDNRAVIVDVGPNIDSPKIKPGKQCFHAKYVSHDIYVEGEKHLLVSDEDIFAIVEDFSKPDTVDVIRNYVLVKPDPENNMVTLKGGLEIEINTSFEPERHAAVKGQVIDVPDIISEKLKTEVECSVADTIYFHFLAMRKAKKMGLALQVDGEPYIFVAYQSCHLALGQGRPHGTYFIDEDNNQVFVVPLNGIILVEPLPDETPDQIGLIVVPDVAKKEHSDKFGVVTYLGTPLKGEVECVKEGDIIIFDKESDVQLEYEMHQTFDGGKPYFRMSRGEVLAILDKDENRTKYSWKHDATI